MERAKVPKFGNWEAENNTPYTVVFDNARKNRGGKMINPNDPQENPDMFPNFAPSAAKPKAQTEDPMGLQTSKRRVSREHGDSHVEPTHNHRYGGRGSNSGHPARQNGGSSHNIGRSPVHQLPQAKVTGRVAASPAWEGKNSYDSSHGTPGRSFESARPTPARYHTKQESHDRGAVVPKFGEWDDKDPQAAENYTEVFNKVRQERTEGTGNVPGTPGRYHQNEKQKGCCFPFW